MNTDLSQPQIPGIDVQSSCNATPGMLVSPYTPGFCYGQAVPQHAPLMGLYRHHGCRLIRLADDPARDYDGSGHHLDGLSKRAGRRAYPRYPSSKISSRSRAHMTRKNTNVASFSARVWLEITTLLEPKHDGMRERPSWRPSPLFSTRPSQALRQNRELCDVDVDEDVQRRGFSWLGDEGLGVAWRGLSDGVVAGPSHGLPCNGDC